MDRKKEAGRNGQVQGWPTMLTEVPFLPQKVMLASRTDMWHVQPPKLKSSRCCRLVLLSQDYSLPGWEGNLCHQLQLDMGLLSPLPCPVHMSPGTCTVPQEKFPECTGQPVVREATLVSLLREDIT